MNTQIARLLALISLTAAMAGCAQVDVKDTFVAQEVPVLPPKASISLEYPNRYDFNKLIALSNDGRYLIDAADKARYIQVWDWKRKEVVQRLLLNEDAPELGVGYGHNGVLQFSGGGRILYFLQMGYWFRPAPLFLLSKNLGQQITLWRERGIWKVAK